MGLKIKNFGVLGVHWKIRLLGGEFTKNRYRGGDCLKREGLGQFADLRGGLARKRGWCFWWGGGGWHTDAHYARAKVQVKVS